MNVKRITVFVLCVIVSIGMLRAATNNKNKEKYTYRTGWTVTASNYKYDFQNPSKTVDGDFDSRWTLGKPQVAGDWIIVDMKTPQKFSVIELQQGRSANDFPRGYAVYLSKDGKDWGNPVITGEGIKGDATVITFPSSVETRYIKIALTKDVSTWWSIHEFLVK